MVLKWKGIYIENIRVVTVSLMASLRMEGIVLRDLKSQGLY